MQGSFAKGTRDVYSRAIRSLKEFLLSLDLSISLPVSAINLGLYIAFMYQQNISGSTLTTYISALSYVHKIKGLQDTTKHFMVIKALEGVRKRRSVQDTRLPITLPILNKLSAAITQCAGSYYKKLLFQAMFQVAFYAFLRVGELTCNSKQQPSISIQDVSIPKGNNFALITIRKYKHSKGIPAVIKIKSQLKSCPVDNLANYISVRGQGNGPLFCR